MLAPVDTLKRPLRFQSTLSSGLLPQFSTMSDTTETILFETSPFGTLDGIVEHDGRVVYFYLNERARDTEDESRFGTRACWVRNLERGPMVLSKADMADGKAPMLPRNDCVDSNLDRIPQPDSLEIVWFEEGNGAALVETDPETRTPKTIAVIPPWSGVDGFHGYASNCAHETPLAWPMPENPSLHLRITKAAEFWKSFTTDESPFVTLQPQLVDAYDRHFGKENQNQYYAIDGGKFPPRGLIRFESESETTLLTVGMSLCAQPAVELFVDHPAQHRRIEIGIRVPHLDGAADPLRIESVMRSISSFAAYPWNNWTWLGSGHTVGWSDAESGKATLRQDDTIKLPSFRGDPVSLLWIEA